MLIIGGGGLGLWATMISKALYGDKIKVAVADASVSAWFPFCFWYRIKTHSVVHGITQYLWV